MGGPRDPLRTAHAGRAGGGRERAVFGADHADLGAELLSKWGLPEKITEPVRHHHHASRLPAGPLGARADLLWLSDCLVRLDVLADHGDVLAAVLEAAERDHGLDVPALVALLAGVAPKVDAFAAVLDIGHLECPDLTVPLV